MKNPDNNEPEYTPRQKVLNAAPKIHLGYSAGPEKIPLSLPVLDEYVTPDSLPAMLEASDGEARLTAFLLKLKDFNPRPAKDIIADWKKMTAGFKNLHRKPQPQKGDGVLMCGHESLNESGHYFMASQEITFTRGDGTTGVAKWFLMCNDCFILSNGDPAQVQYTDDGIHDGEPVEWHGVPKTAEKGEA